MRGKITRITIGLACLLSGVTACGWGDSSEDYLARANQFLGESNYKSAIIELKNALQENNQSAEARYRLGKAYLDTGDVLSAEKELQRASNLGWPADDVVPELATARLQMGQFAEVREFRSSGLSPAAEARLLTAQALAAMSMGDSWDAEELIFKAFEKAPNSVDVLLAKARLSAAGEDLSGANDTLDLVFTQDPSLAEAWSLRGDILMRQRDFDGALSAYTKSVELQKNNYGDLFKRALLTLQMGQYEAAQTDTSALLKIAPQHPGANYIQGLIHYQAGKYADAATALSVAEPAFQQYPMALFFLASAQLLQGKMDQAATLAARFHSAAPGSEQGRKLLATIRLQEGKYLQVQTLLQPILAANPDDVDALNLSANALLREGKTNEGIALLSRVATLQPDSPVAQVRLGAGLLMGGQGDSATRHMETALELNPEFQQADILLVLNYLQEKDFPAAIKAAEAYQRRNLTSVTPYNLLGKVYQDAGQPEEARAAFQQALALDEGDPAANHNLAQIAIAENDLAGARKYYETILMTHKDSAASLIQLALLDAREGDEDMLVAHLERAMAASPSAIQPRLLLGRYFLGKGRPEQVAPLFTNLSNELQQSPEVLQIMAMAQLSGKDPGSAQFTLEQLLESIPDNAGVHHMMAMAAAGAGDNKRAQEELARALVLDENYLPSRIALARIALATNASGEFDDHLAKLGALAPEHPDVLLLQAVSRKRAGDDAAALQLAQKAFSIAPSSATLITVASYEERTGDRKGALVHYANWLTEHPEDITVKMAYAESLQADKQFSQAGEIYAEVLQSDPDNLIALNNQAWIIREKDPGKALEYARRASTLAPRSADVLDTLAVVEYLNKDYKRASRSIQRALQANANNPSLHYHSAMIAAAAGDKTAATATLKELLATGTDFSERAEAEALLAEIGD